MHVEEVPEFLNIAKELLGDARVWDMQKYIQHGSISCLEHSFVVSYYSFTLVRKLRMSCDERSLVRGALLHDYFLYDWHEAEDWHRLHGFRHPFFANRNALRDFSNQRTGAGDHPQAYVAVNRYTTYLQRSVGGECGGYSIQYC